MSDLATNHETYRADINTVLSLPWLAAEVPAGFPSPADDFLEDMLDFNTYFIKNPSSTFWKRVKGDSMKDMNIFSGSWLLIDRSIKPMTGHIAVCWIDGEFTVKELLIDKEVIWLVPRNASFEPIKVTKDNEFVIWGVVRLSVNPFVV